MLERPGRQSNSGNKTDRKIHSKIPPWPHIRCQECYVYGHEGVNYDLTSKLFFCLKRIEENPGQVQQSAEAFCLKHQPEHHAQVYASMVKFADIFGIDIDHLDNLTESQRNTWRSTMSPMSQYMLPM